MTLSLTGVLKKHPERRWRLGVAKRKRVLSSMHQLVSGFGHDRGPDSYYWLGRGDTHRNKDEKGVYKMAVFHEF